MKPILFLIFIILSTGMNAQRKVHVHLNTGEEHLYQFEVMQRFSFENANLNVHLKDQTSESFLLENIHKITFSSIEDAIRKDKANSEISFSIKHGYLHSLGVTDMTSVTIYSIDGRISLQSILCDDQPLYIDQLPSGIFFLNIQGKPFKFAR